MLVTGYLYSAGLTTGVAKKGKKITEKRIRANDSENNNNNNVNSNDSIENCYSK